MNAYASATHVQIELLLYKSEKDCAFHFLQQIAITGKGFHKAYVLATGLIMKNILRIGKVNVIGDVILFLGKLCVSLFCALFAFLMLDTHKYKSAHNKISSPLIPVLVRISTLFCLFKFSLLGPSDFNSIAKI